MNNNISIENKNYNLIDLTHTLSENITTYEGTSGFNIKTILDYKDCNTETKFRIQKLCLNAGIGTHIDAPSHCILNGKNISEINLDQLILPIYCLNISDKISQNNPNYYLTVDDIYQFEHNFEIIKPNSLFILYTGWSQNWPNPIKYRNSMQFPGFSTEAADLLIKRNTSAIAIDTLSIDGANQNHPVHKIILNAQKYIIENIANCGKLDPIGYTAIIAPLKIKDGTEAPARIFAIKSI